MPDPFNVTNSQKIILLAARYGVPAIYFTPTYFAESGGLVAYGSDFAEQFPEAAIYVDRILKGAKPAELPVQAPTKFDLVINLKPQRRSILRCRYPCSCALLALSNETGRFCPWRPGYSGLALLCRD